MFITEAQKQQIRSWITGLQDRIAWMQNVHNHGDKWAEDLTLRLAAERALHTSCEYMTDIGSLIIDALVMRDPGGYADIIKVLVEEDVLAEQWFQRIESVFEFRARLIRDHSNITSEQVEEAVRQYAPLMPEFIDRVSDYLKL